MKKTGKLVAGLLVVVILSGSYFLLKDHNKKVEEQGTEEDTEQETAQVLAVPASDLLEIRFTLDGQDAVFEKTEDTWVYKNDKEFPLKQDKLTDITNQLENVEADRILEDINSLEEYGLDNPQNTVYLVDKDGQEQTIYVGNENSSTSQYYLRLNEDKSTVYVVPSSTITPFTGELYDFAQADSFPTITSSDIQQIQVEKDENPYVLQASSQVSSGWLVGESIKNLEDADSAQAYTLMSTVGTLSYNQFVDYNCTDKSVYGLDQPYAVITIDYEETVEKEVEEEQEDVDNLQENDTEESDVQEEKIQKQLVLNVGDTCSGGRYVNLEGTDGVYAMSEDTLSGLLDKKAGDFWNLTINYVPIADIGEFTVSTEDSSVTVEAKEELAETEETGETEEKEEAGDIVEAEQNSQDVEGSEDELQENSLDSQKDLEQDSQEEEPEMVINYYIKNEIIDSLEFRTFYSSVVNLAAEKRLEEEYKPEGDAQISFAFKELDGTASRVDYYSYDTNFYVGIRDDGKQYLVNKLDIKNLQKSWEELLAE